MCKACVHDECQSAVHACQGVYIAVGHATIVNEHVSVLEGHTARQRGRGGLKESKTHICNALIGKLDQALSIDDDVSVLLLIDNADHLYCLRIHCCCINSCQHALLAALQAYTQSLLLTH